MVGKDGYGTMVRGVGWGAGFFGHCVNSVDSGCYNVDSQWTIERRGHLLVCSAVCECVWVGP